jgi:hypothetical protein
MGFGSGGSGNLGDELLEERARETGERKRGERRGCPRSEGKSQLMGSWPTEGVRDRQRDTRATLWDALSSCPSRKFESAVWFSIVRFIFWLCTLFVAF